MAHTLVNADKFFATARERYKIKLRRESGAPPPWTNDTHFQTWRFTNVHREDDRTTVWLRENIRGPLSEKISKNPYVTIQDSIDCTFDMVKLLEGVLIFRWFNRISTGEIIKDLLLGDWNTEEARRRLEFVSPVVTGAYIIKAGDGVSKLDGILDCIDSARPKLPKMIQKWANRYLFGGGLTLQDAWSDLKELHYMGPFMAYEVVTDLRWTPLLDEAKDIMTWGNLGPGAMRGMGWVTHNDPTVYSNSAKQQREMLSMMADLLALSRQEVFWPQEWPHWEMHEVEMWLCEFAKYMAAYYGKPQKRRYSYGEN
jgi:hypothetical protein